MNRFSTRGLVAGLAATAMALGLAACSTPAGPAPSPTDTAPAPTTEAPAEPVTLRFWHNATADPQKGIWEKAARDFEASHPGVTIEVTGYQNEELQRTLIPQALQAGGDAAPEVFMVWPGGEVRAQAEAGHLKDLTSLAAGTIAELGGVVKPWEVDGKQYALPYTFGITGIWYNKDLFAQAGITGTPKTLPELADAVAKLKAINVAPIAVGAGDKWPAGHWWYQFALNTCSVQTLQTAIPALDFTDPCWIQAGEKLQEWMKTEPFQEGFLATSAQQGADSSAGMVANGKAAMEFMGHWNAGQIGSLAPDGQVPAFLGWFPFPSIPDTAGDPTVTMGGGDGFGVYKDAPDVAVEFVEFLLNADNQSAFGAAGSGIPVNPAAADSITDENLKAIAQGLAASSYVQLWLDSALGPEFGNPLNDAIVNLMGGKGTPQDIVDALEKTAANL
ncbi:MAG: extracellular solute-binding protein [Propionibacteriaceae bacterium]|nr:extracellular solute-binding protein [Propionibacteriaceae bacterium]